MTCNRLLKYRIWALPKLNIFQFIRYNFLSKNVHRAKGSYIIPFRPGKIYLDKDAEIILNGRLILNKPQKHSSLNRGVLFMQGNSRLIVNGRACFDGGYNVESDGVLQIDGGFYAREGSRITCYNHISIGDGSSIGLYANIRDTTGHPTGTDSGKLTTTSAPVVIGKHVWIGANATIYQGSVIGDGSIIGNGAKVKGNVAARAMVAPPIDKEILTDVYWYTSEDTKKSDFEKFYSDDKPLTERVDTSSASEDTIRKVCDVFSALGYDNGIREQQDLMGSKTIDSLSMLSLIAELEKTFEVKIPVTELNARNFYSIGTIALLIERLILSNRNANPSGKTGKTESDTAKERKPLELREEDTNKPIVQRIFENAIKHPDKIAVITKDTQTTYRELCSMIYAFSEEYRKYGVAKGDRVIFQALCDVRYIAAFYACHLLSAIPVPVEKEIGEARIIEIADETESKLIVCDRILKHGHSITYEMLSSDECACTDIPYFELVFPAMDGPAQIVFTTGTTGKSKGVVNNYRFESIGAYLLATKYKINHSETQLLLFPLNHSMGILDMHTVLAYGQTILIGSTGNGLSLLTDLVSGNNVTAVCVPPAYLRVLMMYKKDLGLSEIDYFAICGAALSKTDLDLFLSVYPQSRLISMYGTSEVGYVSGVVLSEEKEFVLGRLLQNVEVKLKIADGEYTQKPNTTGLICVKSPTNMIGYYNEPELTQSIRDGEYIVISDYGYFDGQGRLHFAGRADDVINIGGFKISPFELETIAGESGLVQESILIKSQDKNGAEYLELLVVPENQDFSADALMSFIKGKVEAYRVPKKITVVDELKKTYNGKLDRKAYRNNN